MKVLYVAEVLGLTKLHYFLKDENSDKHDEYLLELLNAGYLEDISDVFPSDKDREMVRGCFGFLEKENNLYTVPFTWSELNKKMRTEEKGIDIITKYNKFLDNPMIISFEEIDESSYEKMYVTEWEDGSESVMFLTSD